MTNKISTAMSDLWKLADEIGVGKIYAEKTRNADKSIRDQFKIDREIPGSFAWGIVKCMSLRSPIVQYSDDECNQITTAITQDA